MFPDGKPLNRLYVYEEANGSNTVYDPDEVLKATDPDVIDVR